MYIVINVSDVYISVVFSISKTIHLVNKSEYQKQCVGAPYTNGTHSVSYLFLPITAAPCT